MEFKQQLRDCGLVSFRQMKHAKKTLVCFHLLFFFFFFASAWITQAFPWNTYVPHKDKEERLITYGELHLLPIFGKSSDKRTPK